MTSNFKIAVASLILGVFAIWNGSSIGIDPSNLIDSIDSGDVSVILLGLINLAQPIVKIVKEKLYNLEFLKSRNFLTNVVTVILVALNNYLSPEISDDPTAIIDAVESGGIGTIVAAVILHLTNFINHSFEKKD